MAEASLQINGSSELDAEGISSYGSQYAAKHKLAPHFIGGNRLDLAPSGPVKEFVANHDGHTVITNVTPSSIALF